MYYLLFSDLFLFLIIQTVFVSVLDNKPGSEPVRSKLNPIVRLDQILLGYAFTGSCCKAIETFKHEI